MDAYDVNKVIVPMYFELGVLVVASIILGLILQVCLEARKRTTRVLFLIFLCYALPIFFAFVPKVLVVTYGADLTIEEILGVPGSLTNWFLVRISSWRISIAFFMAGMFGISVLDKLLFHDGVEAEVRAKAELRTFPRGSFAFFLVGVAVQLFFLDPADDLLGFVSFIILGTYAIYAYLPFLSHTIKIYARRDALPIQRRGVARYFIYLALMTVFSITVGVMFGLDALCHFVNGGGSYTAFYYFAWMAAILAFVTAYSGFIRPSIKFD